MVFGDVVRKWRKARKLSQYELALSADVSQRHLSCLETGRSRPSRPMVMQLAEALDIPLRDRNELLSSAGFSTLYKERGLDSEQMNSVRSAIEQILQKHEPYPCVVVDRFWNIVKANPSMQAIQQLIPQSQVNSETRENLALLTLHPDGLRPLVNNFEQTVTPFVHRLRREMLRYSDEKADKFSAQIEGLIQELNLTDSSPDDVLMPTLSMELNIGDTCLSLFSVISTFGTPQDVTTDELRIELFFPADDSTKAFFESINE